MSGFNFNPSSSGTSFGGMFGTSNNKQPGGNPFSSNAGGTFGNTPATTGGEQRPMFGGTGGGNTGFNLGGFNSGDNKSDPAKPMFGAPQPPGTPGTTGPTSFGLTTPSSGPSWTFGNPSTTPAGPPPSTSGFGVSTGGSNTFGSNNTAGSTSASANTSKPFSFGQPSATTSSSATAPTPATTAPNMFGSTPIGGSFFQNKTSESTPASGGMFANAMPEKPGDNTNKPPATTAEPSRTPFSFNAPAASNPTTTSGSSIFGTGPIAPLPGGGFFPKTTGANTSSRPPFSFPTVTTQSTSSSTPASSGAAPQNSMFSGLGGATTTAASTSSTPSFFSGGFANTNTTSAPSTTTPAATTASGGSFFTSLKGGGTTTAASSTPATTASAFSFATPAATTASQPTTTAPTTTASTTTTSSAAPPTTATASTPGASTTFNTNLGASTTGPIPPAQSRLRNKTMDEILTRWATDLTRYSKEFKNHAETIAQWDQVIVANSQNIDKLYVTTRTCEKQTMSVEMQLAAVENQQNELESWLSKYESDVEEMLAKDGANQSELGGPDQDRERTYKLAERLGERLDDIGRDLESMVEEVNAANASLSKHTKSDEPITQIVRILNSHLTQLQVIDQGTSQLQSRVTAAQKAASGLNYLNGSTNGDARAAVDDFYRSYMGRR